MPRAPVIGAATTDNPGRNLAPMSALPPHLPISDSLCRTHESGDIETRHSSRRIL
jgi:hypothetical protein